MRIIRQTWVTHDVVEDCPDLLEGRSCPGHFIEEEITNDEIEVCETCQMVVSKSAVG